MNLRKSAEVNFSDMVENLCEVNGWFTIGTYEQFRRVLRCCDEPGFSMNEIASMIWICSENADYGDIYSKLTGE